MKNIAIVTPLKDEVNNIDRLIESIVNSTFPIYSWIIVENDSSDGSKEKLEKIKEVKNVKFFKVLNMNFEDKSYQLGIKYSTVVNYGFEFLKNTEPLFEQIDFIGILDSDCFPHPNYYQELTTFINTNRKIGISSGVILFDNGKPHNVKLNHVRGSGRLWAIECFKDAGYIIGMSADSLSSAKAKINGWLVEVCPNAYVNARIAGARNGFEYYGASAYYRGNTLSYAVLKSLKNLAILKWQFAYGFFIGYLKSYMKNTPRVQDTALLTHFKKQTFKALY